MGDFFLLIDQLAENYDIAAEGAFILDERERESGHFLWSLPLFNFYSKLNLLGPHSFNVNEPYDGSNVSNSTWVYHIWRHSRTSLYGRLYSRSPFIKELWSMGGTYYIICPCPLVASSSTSHQTTKFAVIIVKYSLNKGFKRYTCSFIAR